MRSSSPGPVTAGRPWWPARGWRAPTARSIPTSAAMSRVCGSCSGSSRSRAASRATSRPRRPARSTRAASSATHSPTPTAPRSTTRSSWSSASSVTARPRRARSPRAGTRTSSSTRSATAPCCPILHLNGYKIANPTVLARIPREELAALLEGYGHRPIFVEGDDPADMHQKMAAALDDALDDIAEIQRQAREEGIRRRPAWPMIVLRTPKGWTGPEVDGGSRARPRTRCRCRAAREQPEHLAELERWLRSYRPEELFDDARRAARRRRWRRAPEGDRRMSANPHANGGLLLQRPARCRTSATTRSTSGAGRDAAARPRASSGPSCAT